MKNDNKDNEMYCPCCHSKVEDHWFYCTECGLNIKPLPNRCNVCYGNGSDKNYCYHCGNVLR